ncbi:ABC transporter ATP-binding protein [Pseudaeromonas paramecii]|uniref:ABC transporter ATP-binding protein n=1 Tax=Pseudaeromonas paramecii TaxID=2138166 RepID=A0ABP8QBN9_9GAMM
MLEIANLSLAVGQQTLMRELNLQLAPGQVHVIIGPNGTGKTTLLRALFGELAPRQGHVCFAGQSPRQLGAAQWRRLFGYMPQNIQLELELSVLEVVVLGRLDSLAMRLADEDILAAAAALQALGIAHLADRPLHALSGGQRQMVLFAQVLLRDPRIMMLDEPVSALDLQHQMQLMEHLCQQTRAKQWVTLVVLHDLNLAAQFADRLIVLADGALQAYGPPAQVLDAALVERLYQVPVAVLRDGQGIPFLRPLRSVSHG